MSGKSPYFSLGGGAGSIGAGSAPCLGWPNFQKDIAKKQKDEYVLEMKRDRGRTVGDRRDGLPTERPTSGVHHAQPAETASAQIAHMIGFNEIPACRRQRRLANSMLMIECSQGCQRHVLHLIGFADDIGCIMQRMAC